ncbi:hypothetical protein OIU78_000516 [Salix suchowensis]|nr:hypothetical protein OIU78_000516 [Salix suchowensis]
MRTYNYLENNHKLHGNVAGRSKCPLEFRICFIYKECSSCLTVPAMESQLVGYT